MIYERIIVIDDDPRIIKSVKMIFPEYEVIDFSNGKMALSYLRKPNDINLVLLDVMMPEMDGLTVLREIKNIKQNIRVVMMTAYGSQDIAVQALRNRADDFIEKPFNIDKIKDKIQHLLSERKTELPVEEKRNKQVTNIERFIKENCHNVSLSAIADQMCLSPKYVSRLFNKGKGTNFREYKLKMKIEKAKSLLKDSSLTIDNIANELGYQNPESFMRIFKRLTKQTPTQYRNGIDKSQACSNQAKI